MKKTKLQRETERRLMNTKIETIVRQHGYALVREKSSGECRQIFGPLGRDVKRFEIL